MQPVCTFIEFIKELTDEEYSRNISYCSSKFYFKNGGCYELVKILKYFLPESEIWVSNDYKHCVFGYKGILYDIDGIVEDNSLFHVATEIDMHFLNDEKLYGRSEIKFDSMKPSEALIKNILNCRIEHLIEKCKYMSDEPNYYKNCVYYLNKQNVL